LNQRLAAFIQAGFVAGENMIKCCTQLKLVQLWRMPSMAFLAWPKFQFVGILSQESSAAWCGLATIGPSFGEFASVG